MLIDIFDKESDRGKETLSALESSENEVWTTSLNLHEILYGCLKTSRPVDRIIGLDAMPYTAEDSRLSSSIEVALEKKGAVVRRMDTMIAAIAINHGAQLLTYNLKHFERMKEFGLDFFRV